MNTNLTFSRREAAEYLGIPYATLATWASIGHPWIPFMKAGNRVVYFKHDLDKFISQHMITSPGDVHRVRAVQGGGR
jgi:excisionase family DNA binding protein